MNKEQFWTLIDEAKINDGNTFQEGIEALLEVLDKMEVDELIAFQHYFDGYKELARKPLIEGLAAICMGVENRDEATDLSDFFIDTLVLMGKDRFLRTLEEPNTFTETFELNFGGEYDIETLNCITYPLVESKTDDSYRDLYEEYVLDEQLENDITYSVNIDIEWDSVEELAEYLAELIQAM